MNGWVVKNYKCGWRIRLDSNQRPLPSEGNALSPELRMLRC